MFGLGVRMSLVLVSLIVAVRRYGIVAVATGQKMKHAAVGRAKSSLFYAPAHSGARIGDHSATRLIESLMRERASVGRLVTA